MFKNENSLNNINNTPSEEKEAYDLKRKGESIFCYENIYIICVFYYFININILLYKMIQNIIQINNGDANVKQIFFRINNYYEKKENIQKQEKIVKILEIKQKN